MTPVALGSMCTTCLQSGGQACPSGQPENRSLRGKIFTRTEADRMVPLIRRIVLNVRARDRLCERKRKELASLVGAAERRAALKSERRHLIGELERYELELEDLGCIMRDRSLGLVECFGELEGEIVYFTLRPGEAAFGFWHSLDTGPSCAVPLPEVEREHTSAAS